LIAALVVGAVLRAYQLGESLWLDELHTSWAVSGSLGDVFERAAIGNQSPLYFWLAWFFARLPGPPEVVLRLPSMLAGCALPAAMYWLTDRFQQSPLSPLLLPQRQRMETTRPVADITAPLVAAWLMAIDPIGVFYAQEARAYALMQLTVVLHIGWLLLVLEKDQWPVRIAWIVSGALLVHWHYTAGLVLLGEAIAVLAIAAFASAPDKRWGLLLHRGGDLLLMLLLIAPALGGILEVAERRQNWEAFIDPPTFSQVWLVYPWTIAILPLIVLSRWRPILARQALLVLTCWLFVPLLTAWCLSRLDVARLFYFRYLLAVWPATLVATALCVRIPTNLNVQAMVIGILMAIAARNGSMLHNWLDDGRLIHNRNENWPAAVARLNELLAEQPAPVFVRSGFIEADDFVPTNDRLAREYCLAPVLGMYRTTASADQLYPLTTTQPGKLTPSALAALREHGRAYLIVRSASLEVREQLPQDIQRALGSERRLVASEPDVFGGVYVQRLEVEKVPDGMLVVPLTD
jgi:hypothetical protein